MVQKISKTHAKKLRTIGSTVLISVDDYHKIPAKIDTGADSSSIWATNIDITKDGVLEFTLFGKSSPFYDGKIIRRTDFEVAVVRSAMGQQQIRYRTHLPIIIKGRKINALFSLSNRSSNNFPILIGKRTIRGRFVVDVAKTAKKYGKIPETSKLNQELRKNPFKFHQKYYKLEKSKGTK